MHTTRFSCSLIGCTSCVRVTMLPFENRPERPASSTSFPYLSNVHIFIYVNVCMYVYIYSYISC